ncbi:MAG: hypothetical protein PHW74_00295 [Desulfobacca sp.]|nr:hypothetical protein [Desulfobacca sp.]
MIMAITNIEYWIFAQLGVEALLVGALVYFLLKIKKLGKTSLNSEALQNLLAETQQLKDQLLGNLNREKDLIHNSIKQLDLRLNAARELLQTLEKRTASRSSSSTLPDNAKTPPSAGSILDRLEFLHQQGYSVEEIAQQLQMSKGEVLVGLDLSRAKAK